MRQRYDDEKEAQRWKRKFLDALEEQEEREKLLSERIAILRRGLLGVSLAGDGVDPGLDEQLAQLRTLLRREDRETGLVHLLEQIEDAVLRLDNRKSDERAALQQALSLSLEQLGQVPLSRELRRRLKRFARSLPQKNNDAERTGESVRDFLVLLRQVVGELSVREEESPRLGLLARLFGNGADTGTTAKASVTPEPGGPGANGGSAASGNAPPLAEDHGEEAPGSQASTSDPELVTSHADAAERPARVASLRSRPVDEALRAGVEDETVVNAPDREDTGQWRAAGDESDDGVAADAMQAVAADDAELELDVTPGAGGEEEEAVGKAQEPAPEADEAEIEGELVRDRSGLMEPGFSYIADHVEPLLLRILENVHVAKQSAQLVSDIERRVRRGLNWYDFVAALEDIVTVISQSVDEEREDFQQFLSQMTENLSRVHAALEASETNQQSSRDADAALDASVREQVSGMQDHVEQSDDLDQLKQSVRGQLDGILGALEQFRSTREAEDHALAEQLQAANERMARMETEAQTLHSRLSAQKEMALRDKLTGLPNRAAYDREIRDACEQQDLAEGRERRSVDRQLCLAVCDIDNFKQINDNFGHLAGDRVLKLLSRELESRLRRSDFMARFGGEEFVILMPDTWIRDAVHVLDKLRRAAEQMPFHFKEQRVQITASFGLTAWQSGDTPESIFERADRAMYLAKKQGRNRCETAED